MAICGVLVEGDWIVKPSNVKKEFLNQFANWFSNPVTPRLILETQFATRLSLDQKDDLERNVTYNEVKRVVWDCGTNKSPKPDGFTFDFFRRYWNLIDQDVVAVVSQFFTSSLYKGIPIDDSLIMSYLFYDDDAVFVVRMGVLNNMEATRRSFFNGIENTDRRISLISWKKIVAFKKDKGLGVSSFFALNRALLFKWICKGIDLLSLMKKKVGNGENTSFWDDIWLDDYPLKHLYLRLYALEIVKHASVAVKFRDSSLISSFRRAPRIGMEEEQLRLLGASTTFVLLPGINDRLVWRLESLGDYSVISTCSFIDDSLLPMTGVPTRWFNAISIKINIFSWRVYLDKLPTRLNLSFHGIDIPSIFCPICSIIMESTLHLLFSCHLAYQIMLKVARWWELEVHDFHSYANWLIWFNNIRLPKRIKKVLEGVFYVIWSVI
ncbi:RNA-directed DNA polymerase, eukaryota [Tanacetum coccineum]